MKKSLPLIFAGLILSTVAGCEKLSSPPAATSRSEASAKFQKIVTDEFHYPVVLRDLTNTVWIYVPLEENLLEYKAKPGGATAVPSPQAQDKIAVRFLQVKFKDNIFNIDYDIGPTKLYNSNDPGYENVYPESFQRKQQNILNTVGRAYLDMEIVPGDVKYDDPQKQATHEGLVNAYVKTDKAPEFFVVVFADIVRGIKMVNTTNFRDLQKVANPTAPLAPEEYMKRSISEITGDPILIGDKTGERLQYRDIVMPEFLAKQIQYRINIKYGQSSFPPSDDAVKEILKIVAETTRAYEFQNFTLIKLHDLASDKILAFDVSQLKTFQE